MIEKISPKESEKETVVPGEIYAVSSDIRNGQGEILKFGSPIQVLQEPKEERVAVKDFRGVQWEVCTWQLSKEAIQESPTRGRIRFSRARMRLNSFFEAVDEHAGSIYWGVPFLFICTSFFTLWRIGEGEEASLLPLIVFGFVFLFVLLLTSVADTVCCILCPQATDYLCKKENLRELEVLLEAQKADVGKEQKYD